MSTSHQEIAAATAVEFVALLRLLQIRSGVTAGDIARRAGIARSQVYALIKEGRMVLPTQLDQVRSFARACGLEPDKVALIEALWVGLLETAARPAQEEPSTAQPVGTPEASTVATGLRRMADSTLGTVSASPSARSSIPAHRVTIDQAQAEMTPDEDSAARGVQIVSKVGDVVAELVDEMKTLRRGRGILESQIEERVGPALRAACGIWDGASPVDIRRAVTARLTELADQLPDDLRNAVLGAFAVLPDTRQRFYQERVRWIANHLERDERTAQRRINEGLVRLAELAAADLDDDKVINPDEGGPAWYSEKMRVSLLLDRPNPEAFEWRRILSNRDGLSEIDLALTMPPPHDALPGDTDMSARLQVSMLYGGLLVAKQDANVHRLSFAVVLPRPLNRGERSEFALRFTVLDGQIMQPHYICVPRQRCALFDLRVRFDRNRLPRQVWQLSKASKHDINDRQEGEPVEVDATGELHLQFNELSPPLRLWRPVGGNSMSEASIRVPR